MVEGSTGLNIKDYPFAFSITALFFPSILNDTGNTTILGILLVGGMLGSLLTIINPINRIMMSYSKRYHDDDVYSDLFGVIIPRPNNLLRNIVRKNFQSALKSPQITFENNKTIGMIYFIIILVSTLIQSIIYENFIQIFSNDYQLWGIRIAAIIGIAAVILVMLNHVFGTNFKFKTLTIAGHKTPIRIFEITGSSHLSRVCCVTTANLAIDFVNLSKEGISWTQNDLTQHTETSQEIRDAFNKLNLKAEKIIGKGITVSYADFENTFSKEFMDNLCRHRGYKWHDSDIKFLFHKYQRVKEISTTYNVEFFEALHWFENSTFFNQQELSDSEPRLRTAIDSRDWEFAELAKFRIVDHMNYILEMKNMPKPTY